MLDGQFCGNAQMFDLDGRVVGVLMVDVLANPEGRTILNSRRKGRVPHFASA